MVINQQLKVALNKKQSNVFIVNAPTANISHSASKSIDPEDASLEDLIYVICTQLLERGIDWQAWKELCRESMARAAVDMYKTKATAANKLGIQRTYLSRLSSDRFKIKRTLEELK